MMECLIRTEWSNNDISQIITYNDRGFYIGLGGPVTFRQETSLVIIKEVVTTNKRSLKPKRVKVQ